MTPELRFSVAECITGIEQRFFPVPEVLAHLRRLERLERAARHLLALKDGPRDDAYWAAKAPAWQALREALADA